MNHTITIRRGKSDDLPFFKDRLIDMWVDHAEKEPSLLDAEQMRKADVEKWYKEAFESDKTVVFVAEVGGKFAGVIRADIDEIPKFFKNNKIFYLDDAFVMPENRGRGIIQALIKEVEKAAKEKGIKRIQARVYSYNEAMQKALESCGFHMPHSTWDKTIS